MYQLEKYNKRLEEFKNNPEAKSLAAEIGITRMTLEQTINKAREEYGDDNALRVAAPTVAQLVGVIDKCVTNTIKLEKESGLLLDQAVVLRMADAVLSCIRRHITDSQVLTELSEDVNEAIATVLEDRYLCQETTSRKNSANE